MTNLDANKRIVRYQPFCMADAMHCFGFHSDKGKLTIHIVFCNNIIKVHRSKAQGCLTPE